MENVSGEVEIKIYKMYLYVGIDSSRAITMATSNTAQIFKNEKFQF